MIVERQLFRRELVKTVAPALLAIALFMGAVFGVFLPAYRKNITAQSRKMIAIVTDAARDVIDHYAELERTGAITRQRAQFLATQQLRSLRYGPAEKDYLWIVDMRPVVLMHPYHPELEGKDVARYADREGNFVFQDMVRTVKNGGAGYLEYLWQWKDDPAHILPKLSHVRLFEPWGWIVGTGVYLDDLDEEIASLVKRTLMLATAILAVIIVLLAVIVRRSLGELRQRIAAQAELAAYQEQLERQVKTLSGLLPICMSCKSIRDDQGYWQRIEQYIGERSEAEFSHSLCPDCAVKLYPDYYKKNEEK